jgi:hypothetical protein
VLLELLEGLPVAPQADLGVHHPPALLMMLLIEV